MINNKYLVLFFYILFIKSLSSQTFNPDQRLNFYDIVDSCNIYFDSLHTVIGESAFYQEGSDYNEFVKWKLKWQPLLSPHGNFELYYDNSSYAKHFLDTTLKVSLGRMAVNINDPWDFVGPDVKPANGLINIGTFGSPRGIGPIEFITIDHDNPNLMLCGSDLGGLFVSTNGGQLWVNAGSDVQWDLSGCVYAVINPNNPDLWIACNGGDLGHLGGLYKTTDAGINWNKIGDENDFGGLNPIVKMELSYSLPDEIAYVATLGGLYKTNDLNTVTPSFSLLTDPNITGSIYDIEVSNNSDVLVATVLDNARPRRWHIVRSNDLGITWTLIPNQPILTGVPAAGNIRVEKTLVDNNLYYFVVDDNTDLSKIYKVNIFSNVWTDLSAIKHYIFHGDGNAFAVSNTNLDEIYVSHDVRYKTRVGGVWTEYSSSSANVQTYHVDLEDFICSRVNSDVWMANHGGVYKSTDNGQTWLNMSDGLGVAQVWRMSSSYTNPAYLMLALYHDGVVRTDPPYTSPWKPDWRTVYPGDGTFALIDYKNPIHMWAAHQGSGSLQRSDNYGLESTYGSSTPTPDWGAFAVLNSADDNTLFSFTQSNASPIRQDVIRTTNQFTAPTTNLISNFNTVNGINVVYALTSLSVSASDPNYLYAHLRTHPVETHHLFRTKNANDPNIINVVNSWEELAIPKDAWFSDLIVDENNPDLVYFTYTSDVSSFPSAQGVIFKVDYSTGNLTPTITDLTKNLPFVGLGRINLQLEKGTNGGMYLATDQGVFYTDNKLINDPNLSIGWTQFGPNIPHVQIHGVEINYVANKIRIATYGRGLWEKSLKCPDILDLIETITYSQNDFIEAENTINSTATIPNTIEIKYRAGESIDLNDGFEVQYSGTFETIIHPCSHGGNSFKYSKPKNSILDDKNSLFNDILIFPNPSTSEITISIPHMNNLEEDESLLIPNSEIKNIRIFNSVGEQVFNKTDIDDSIFKIDINSLVTGVYFIKVDFHNKTFIKKLVKI